MQVRVDCLNTNSTGLPPSRKEGGHLASIDSQEVDDYFAEKNQRVWIGGSDLNLEGTWTWSDCSRWNWTNWDKANLGGDNFWPDQPDNHTVGDYQLTNANTNIGVEQRRNQKSDSEAEISVSGSNFRFL